MTAKDKIRTAQKKATKATKAITIKPDPTPEPSFSWSRFDGYQERQPAPEPPKVEAPKVAQVKPKATRSPDSFAPLTEVPKVEPAPEPQKVEAPKAPAIPGILIDLTIGCPGLSRADVGARQKLADDNEADATMLTVNKRLVRDDRLKKIQQAASKVRTYYYQRTLPWDNGGQRLLLMVAPAPTPAPTLADAPTTAPAPAVSPSEKFLQELIKRELEYKDLVNTFCTAYAEQYQIAAAGKPEDTEIFKAEGKLGKLFKLSDYPKPEVLKTSFFFSWIPLNVPDGDVRCSLSDGMKEQIRVNTERQNKERLSAALVELWQKLYRRVCKLRASITSPSGRVQGKTIGHLEDLVQLAGSWGSYEPGFAEVCTTLQPLLEQDHDAIAHVWASEAVKCLFRAEQLCEGHVAPEYRQSLTVEIGADEAKRTTKAAARAEKKAEKSAKVPTKDAKAAAQAAVAQLILQKAETGLTPEDAADYL